MKYLGIDYGSKRVGVAVSNEEGTISFPRATFVNDEKLIASIVKMVEDEKVAAIVVGDTRALNGRENPVTEAAEKCMEEVARETGLPVSRAFEAWSSIEASRYAPRRAEPSGRRRYIHDDASAAAIILQRFLDMHAKQ